VTVMGDGVFFGAGPGVVAHAIARQREP